MAVNFPDSPSNGDTFVVGSLTYTYTASTDVWDASGVTSAAIQISDTAPSNPSDGELWHNSSDLKLYIYYNDGSSSQWVVASPQQIGPTGAAGQVHMGIASPSAPASGEMWYDTETNDFSLYYEDGTSNQWITVSGPKGDDGADATLSSISESIIPDTDSAYDLGSPTNKFRSLYLSSNTLFLGDSASISAGPGGEIILPSIKIGTGDNAVKLEADASGKLKTKKVVGGVTQAAEEPGNATVVTDMAGLIALTGMGTGQIALVSALNKMFVYTGSGWFLIATVTNSSPTDITGVDATYNLATDGTATIITAVSTDPEGFPLTWSYAVTTGSLGSTATVSQADNVFTVTPSTTEADAGSFSITFSVTDGATGAVSAVSAFTLGFTPDWSSATRQAKFTANDIASGDEFGISVNINEAGDTAIIGSPNSDPSPSTGGGSAYIFTRSGTTWTQQAKLVTASPSNYQYAGGYPSDLAGEGGGVAISNDGNTAVVNIPYADDNGTNTGRHEVWTRSGTTWTSQATLLPTAPFVSSSGQYTHVEMSGDGDTIISGHPWDGSNKQGSVYIYHRTGTTWTLEHKSVGTVSHDNCGLSVCLSYDGNTAAFFNAASTEIWGRSGSTWTQTQVLTESDDTEINAADLGSTGLCFSKDGNTLVLGNDQESVPGLATTSEGCAHVYTLIGGTWTHHSRLDEGVNAGQQYKFGSNVTVNDAGTVVGVGSYSRPEPTAANSNDGAIFVYRLISNVWTEDTMLINTDGESADRIGRHKMSANGRFIIGGSNHHQDGYAFVWVP